MTSTDTILDVIMANHHVELMNNIMKMTTMIEVGLEKGTSTMMIMTVAVIHL